MSSDNELTQNLASVFSVHGYSGATMTALANASGLKKASLYHRFPGGKEEMAAKVLQLCNEIVEQGVIGPLNSQDLSLEQLADLLIEQFDLLYQGGKDSCILNMLSHPINEPGPFSDAIRLIYQGIIKAIARVVELNGLTPENAKQKAITVMVLTQGGLIVSRGTGNTEPFNHAMTELRRCLLVD